MSSSIRVLAALLACGCLGPGPQAWALGGPTNCRISSGTWSKPFVDAIMKSADPCVEADWRLSITGGHRGEHRSGPMDRVSAARVDIWLEGFDRAEDLQIPSSILTTIAPEDAIELLR